MEQKGHDSGSDSSVVRKLREEIRELNQRLEQCDNNRGHSEATTASEADDDKAEDDLAAKCRDLEETLDLMRGEFENMEDYWQVGCKILTILRILFFVLVRR